MGIKKMGKMRKIGILSAIFGLLFLFGSEVMAKKNDQPLNNKEKSSIALINEAYHDNKIDKDRWLILKTQAIFKHEKLPLEYKGTKKRIKSLSPFILEIHDHWQDISEKTKKELSFLLLRPTDPEYVVGAWGDLAYTVPEAMPYDTTHFRIHYVESTNDAPDLTDTAGSGVPDYVETVGRVFEEVYVEEITNMNYDGPPADDALGGDNKYDIYLKEIGQFDVYGWADPEALGFWKLWKRTSYSFIVIDDDYQGFPGQQEDNLKVTAAHEFFHAIQFGYDAKEDPWWKEATATWMEDEVYDGINDYFQYLDNWFVSPQTALDDLEGTHEYGSCVYAKYLSEKEGGPDRIRTIWEKCRGRTQSLKAIEEDLGDAAIFKNVFKNFTVCNFIQNPNEAPLPLYGYEEEGEGVQYPDVNIEADYPADTGDINEHYVGKAPLPLNYGNNLDMADDKELPNLAAHYLKISQPSQLDKPTKIYLNFKKGPGSIDTWGKEIVLVRQDDSKLVRQMVKGTKGGLLFNIDKFGVTENNPKDTEIKEIVFIPSSLKQRSRLRKYQYSVVIVPQFEDAYTPYLPSGTTNTVNNLATENVYNSGDTINLEVNLSYKAKVTADFFAVDANFNADNVSVTELDASKHTYGITYTVNTIASGNSLPVTIRVEDLTGTGFNTDETFVVNPAGPEITVISPLPGEVIDERQPVIKTEIISPRGVAIDTSSVVMILDGSVVTHDWSLISADGSSIEVYYTPTDSLDYGGHTVIVDAKDINGISAEQKTWSFTIDAGWLEGWESVSLGVLVTPETNYVGFDADKGRWAASATIGSWYMAQKQGDPRVEIVPDKEVYLNAYSKVDPSALPYGIHQKESTAGVSFYPYRYPSSRGFHDLTTETMFYGTRRGGCIASASYVKSWSSITVGVVDETTGAILRPAVKYCLERVNASLAETDCDFDIQNTWSRNVYDDFVSKYGEGFAVSPSIYFVALIVHTKMPYEDPGIGTAESYFDNIQFVK